MRPSQLTKPVAILTTISTGGVAICAPFVESTIVLRFCLIAMCFVAAFWCWMVYREQKKNEVAA